MNTKAKIKFMKSTGITLGALIDTLVKSEDLTEEAFKKIDIFLCVSREEYDDISQKYGQYHERVIKNIVTEKVEADKSIKEVLIEKDEFLREMKAYLEMVKELLKYILQMKYMIQKNSREKEDLKDSEEYMSYLDNLVEELS